MALDMFIKIDGIKGESTDDKHKDEIDVLSWSWGMSQAAAAGTGAGAGSGKVSIRDLTITKRTDVATPKLMLSCCTGSHIREATLTVRKAGGARPQDFLSYKLSDILVTSVGDAVNGGDQYITEQVTLNFAKVELNYSRQKPDGTLEAPQQFKWDIKANKTY